MGLSGPIPLDSYAQKRRGETRPSRAKRAPATPSDVPIAPEWLTEDAAAVWARTIAALVSQGVPITTADTDLLTRYCMTWVTWKQLADEYLHCEKLAKDYRGSYLKKTPLFTQFKEVGNQLLAMQSELGLTPKARIRLGKVQADDDDDSGLD